MHLAGLIRKIFQTGLLSAVAYSQSQSQDPLNRDSPQSSVFFFLEASHSRNYGRAAKYLDLRKLPQEQRLSQGPQLAQQLAAILDRAVSFDVASLSRQPGGDTEDGLATNREHIESFTVDNQKLELQLERVKLPSGLEVWLFSSDSVALIPRLAQM